MKMNWKILFAFLVCICLIIDVTSSEKQRKKVGKNRLKKWRKMELEKTLHEAEQLKEELEHELELDNASEELSVDEEKTDNEIEETDDEIELETDDQKEVKTDDQMEEEQNIAEYNEDNSEEDIPSLENPCDEHHCGAGKECKVTEEGRATCECVDDCVYETDERRKVCSNHNETWHGECLLHQMRCWCHSGDERCKNPDEYKHLHIDYYGQCQQIQPCTENEMIEFPERMRKWLFYVMRDLADRRELSTHYLQLEREAEDEVEEQNLKWTNAVIWKWCDLDGHPKDNKVSRHELFPIRAPLIALEHCMAPFLDLCDEDENHYITLTEWGKCLNIPQEVLEDKCEMLTKE